MKNKIKLLVIAAFILAFAAVGLLNAGGATYALKADDDIKKLYKQKCLMCHGPTALKKYEPCMAMEEQVRIILKGEKGEKPPPMPGYETKGVSVEQAKALAEYMVALRTPEDGELDCSDYDGS